MNWWESFPFKDSHMYVEGDKPCILLLELDEWDTKKTLEKNMLELRRTPDYMKHFDLGEPAKTFFNYLDTITVEHFGEVNGSQVMDYVATEIHKACFDV